MPQEFSVLVGIDSGLAKKGAREFDMASKKVQNSARKMDTSLDKTQKSMTGMGNSAFRLRRALGVIGITGFTAAMAGAVKQALAFEGAMAEVKTLIDDSFDPTNSLKGVVQDLSKQFAQAPIAQAKALYQVISAGAKTAAEATQTLTAANKLAVGGVTDVATAADGLTSIMNAYGLTASDATEISDAMFVAMRAGKTTIAELSSAVGLLAPIASATGVSIDEMLTATAALTKGGLSTSQAMTGLRQTLANVLKPTKAASQTADQLGIAFGATALKTKGLAGFLEEIIDKAGNNTDALVNLFGSVESLNAIMALTSSAGGKDFTAILDTMKQKLPETEKAVKKVTESMDFQAKQLKAQLTDAYLKFGQTLLVVVGPAIKFLNENLEAILRVIQTLVVVGIAVMIVKLGVAAVTMISTAGAAGTLTIAMTALNKAFWALGGPAGLIFLAVTFLATWSSTAEAAGQTTARLNAEMGTLVDKFKELGEFQQVIKLEEAIEDIEDTRQAIFLATGALENLQAQQERLTAGGEGENLAITERVKELNAELESLETQLLTEEEVFARQAQVSTGAGLAFAETALSTHNLRGAMFRLTAEQVAAKEAAEAVAAALEEETLAGLETGETIQGLNKIETRRFESIRGVLNPLADLTKTYANDLRIVGIFSKFTTDATFDLATAEANLTKRYKEAVEALTGVTAAQKKLAAERKSAKRLVQDLIASTSKLKEEDLRHARAQEALKEAMETLNLTAEQQAALLKILKDQHEENIEQINAMCEKIDEVKECTEDATQAMQDAWKRATERMDDLLVDLFEDAFDGFDDFVDGIKKAFKRMLAEMAHAALTRPIIVKIQTAIAGAIGIPGGGGAGGGAGGGIAGGGPLAGALGTLGAGAAGFAIGSGLGQALGGSEGVANTGAAIGATIGAVVGGPIGAFIGGILGGGIGAALFGGKKTVTAQGVNLGISGGEVFGEQFTDIHKKGGLLRSSKRFTKTSPLGELGEGLQDALSEAFGVVSAIAEALGASGDAFEQFNLASQRLDLKGLSEEEAQERIKEFLQNAIGAGIEFFIRNTEGLSERLRQTVLSFAGNAEDLIDAFEAAAVIDLALAVDPITEGTKIFADSQRVLLEVYEDQREALALLLEEYDGSLGSLQELAEATALVKRSQLELVVAFLQVGEAVRGLFMDTAQMIRETLLSDEELFNLRQDQIAVLVQELSHATSPDEIARISAEIDQLVRSSFGLLDEDQQAAMAGGFLTFLDDVLAIADERIGLGLDQVDADASQLEADVSAQLIATAAEVQAEAAREFREGVREFREGVRAGGGGGAGGLVGDSVEVVLQ